MNYDIIAGILRNNISLRDSILIHVKDVSLKYIKRCVDDHSKNHPRYTFRMHSKECNIDIVYCSTMVPYWYKFSAQFDAEAKKCAKYNTELMCNQGVLFFCFS